MNREGQAEGRAKCLSKRRGGRELQSYAFGAAQNHKQSGMFAFFIDKRALDYHQLKIGYYALDSMKGKLQDMLSL